MSIELKMKSLGLVLPTPPSAKGLYQPVYIDGKYAYVSGHGPLQSDGTVIRGKVGLDIDEDAAKIAARQTALAILASLQFKLGSLDRIKQVVKIFGMVNSTPDFTRHPYVINGCSELFAELIGPDRGVGARSAMGASSLPDNYAVEIEAIFELTD